MFYYSDMTDNMRNNSEQFPELLNSMLVGDGQLQGKKNKRRPNLASDFLEENPQLIHSYIHSITNK